MEGTKPKKNIGLIIFLIIIILGLICYIAYDKFVYQEPVVKEDVESVAQKEDITNSDLAEELHESLIAGGVMGPYFKEGVTIDKTDDIRFIRFALASYIDEKDVELQRNICGAPSDDTNTYITKDELNSFINKKFNNSLKYDLPLFDEKNPDNNIYHFYGIYTLESYDGKWAVTCNGDTRNIVDSKLVKAEQEGDYIYVYDNAVICSTNDMAGYYCSKFVDSDEAVLECDLCTENNSDCKHDDICPSKTDDDYIEAMADTLLEKNADKLATFKHTFKKDDGKYYLVSSEVEKN